jgi:RecA-family ATPase
MGKTLLELQRVVAHVTGQFWLGMEVAQGPAMYIGAEDEADEIQRRVVDIARHYGAKFSAMKGNLHLLSLAGEDAVLAAPNKNRVLQPTPLFWRIKEAACDIRPKLIVLDTSSDIYAGDENDRAQVRQFVGLVRGLAIASNSNVEICSHPSLTGINSKSGLSGSTGWHNSVRARSYLTVPEKGDELDPKLRRLEFKKNNYGPKAEDILLRWENGVYVLEPGAGSLEKRAADHRTEEVFLTLLSQFDRQGRTVSDKPNAPTFAPAMFSKEPAAEKNGKEAFHAAMRRLFAAGRIRVETYGRPSRPNSKIVACN